MESITKSKTKSKTHVNGQPPPLPTIEQALIDIFFNGTVRHAVARMNGDALSYIPVESNPSPEEMTAHVYADHCLGSYTLLPDNTVRWICLDVDCKQDLAKARNITEEIAETLAFANPVIEFSGGKGYHIWLFLHTPVTASRAKAFGIAVREAVGAPSSGDPHVEVYPKQEKLTKELPIGNLVKLPLGLHRKSGRRSVFCRVGSWETEPIEDPLPLLLRRVELEELETKLENATPIKRLTTLLSPYWTDGGRHELCLYLAGYLGNSGWTLDDCQKLVDELIDGYGGDAQNLTDCVVDTYRKIARGATVKGFSGLAEIIPTNVLSVMGELVSHNIANPILQLLDRVRLGKAAAYLKVRQAANLIYPNLTEKGRFIQPIIDEGQYWFEHETHKLWDCSTPEWQTMLFKHYGLVTRESFYAQVYQALEHMWRDGSVKLPIYHRFHWDGTNLWLNLGDEKVYKLDSETITLTYNGEGNLLFRNESDGPCELVPNLLDVTPVNPWDYLTGLLSFAAKDGVTGADPEEQRNLLQAFLLSMAFPEIAPTKPIVGILGPRGSGKTSACRNISRIWHKPYDDVLSVTDDKPDSFRTSIEHTTLLAMDNLETSTAKWLAHIMAKISTGAQIEIRTLYKTNAKSTIRPYCYMLFSAIELPEVLKSEQLASRILPLQLAKVQAPQSENYLQQAFYDNYGAIWAGLVRYLNQCIPLLRATEAERSKAEEIRLADFANFCRRIRDLPTSIVDHGLVESGIKHLSRQQEQLAPVSHFIQALELWFRAPFKEDPAQPRTLADLFPMLERIARGNQLDWRWKTANGLATHVRLLEDKLCEDYGCIIGETQNAKGNRNKTYSFKNG